MDFIVPVRVTVDFDMEVDGEIVEMSEAASKAAAEAIDIWMSNIVDGNFSDYDAEILTEMLADATGFCINSIWVGVD